MKVLVYTTLFPNQLQPNNAIFIKQRMFHFAKLDGCEIKVVAPTPYCPPWPSLGKRYRFSQIKKYELMDGIDVFHPRYPLVPKVSMLLHGLSLFMSSLSTVKKIYHEFPFDIIDGHYIYPDGLAAVLLGMVFKKPVVLSARGSDIHQFTRFISIKPMIRYALNKSDHVISVCEALKQEIINVGTASEKISVVPNGIDTKQFYPEDKIKARKELSIHDDSKVIITVGSLIPLKGYHVLLDAMPAIVREMPQTHLYVVGEGPYRSYLEQKIRHLSLHQHVTLVGECPNRELKTWYSASDVLCLASSKEGWPNVVMESLACGTPVVATRVYGVSEILTSSDVGVLVDRTPNSLYHGLKTALETTWDIKLIRAHVRDRDWFKVADEVQEAFNSVLYNDFENKRSGQIACL